MIILPTPENVKRHTTGQQRPIFNCSLQLRLTVELLAIRLRAPLSTVSRSCSEQLKTPSSLAGGVAFVPKSVLKHYHQTPVSWETLTLTILDTGIYVCLFVTPRWILKRGGLESFGQGLISSNVVNFEQKPGITSGNLTQFIFL